MKKAVLAVLAFSMSTAFAKTTITCTSSDFDPSGNNGEQLVLTFDRGDLVGAKLAEGSWGCSGQAVDVTKVATNKKVNVYALQFGEECSDFAYDQRVLISNSAKVPKAVTYMFAYLSDDAPGHVNDILKCK